MAQDIREMFKNEEHPSSEKLREGHEKRFEARLDKAFHQEKKRNSFLFFKIAAVFVVALGVGLFFFIPGNGIFEDPVADTPVEEESDGETIPTKQFQLSDVSSEFKKIEDYYLASINMELAGLEINDDNKKVIDAFMAELAKLDKEYERLNNEISETGPNEEIVEAMIANLQMRLDLLLKLKTKLNELQLSKNNDYENLQA